MSSLNEEQQKYLRYQLSYLVQEDRAHLLDAEQERKYLRVTATLMLVALERLTEHLENGQVAVITS